MVEYHGGVVEYHGVVSWCGIMVGYHGGVSWWGMMVWYDGGGTLTLTLTLTLASIRQYSEQVTIGLPNDYCRGTYREIGYITVNRLHDIFVYASIT